MTQKSYFLGDSSWIANFGVVPLFRFAFFLFAPAFLVCLVLLDSVIFVFETIFLLLSHTFDFTKQLLNKHSFLHSRMRSVKTIIISCIFSITWSSIVWGTVSLMQYQTIIISKGEHREIPIHRLKKFTIGNHEIIGHKLFPKKKHLLIKGRKLGFTELFIWTKLGTKEVYRIYVISKRKHLKILHLAQIIRSVGLQTEMAGPLIIVKGELVNLSNYQLIKKIEKNNHQNMQIRGSLHPKLRNQIIGEIYHLLFNENVEKIRCYSEFFNIYCHYPKSNPPSKDVIDHLIRKYYAHFIPSRSFLNKQNYLIKFKIIQIEKLNGEELGLGLDKLSGSLSDLFDFGVTNIIKKNQIILSSKNVHVSTLAEPETIVRIGVPATIQVGADIPYSSMIKNNGVNQVITNWKFAGLKIKLTINQIGNKLKVKYQTEFTRPIDNHGKIGGNKESSEAMIKLSKPLQIFQIGFKTAGKNISGFPWLSEIPILGELFKSKSNQSNYKKISGIVILEKHGP